MRRSELGLSVGPAELRWRTQRRGHRSVEARTVKNSQQSSFCEEWNHRGGWRKERPREGRKRGRPAVMKGHVAPPWQMFPQLMIYHGLESERATQPSRWSAWWILQKESICYLHVLVHLFKRHIHTHCTLGLHEEAEHNCCLGPRVTLEKSSFILMPQWNKRSLRCL